MEKRSVTLCLTSLLLFSLCFGCSQTESGSEDEGILRSKNPTYGDAHPPTPRSDPASLQRQFTTTLTGAQKKTHHLLYGRPREESSLGPGDPYPDASFSSLRRALATRLPLAPSAFEPGCADGTREGFISLPVFPDIAACEGGDMGLTHIDSPEANAHCAPGWHVCSPARDAADAAIVGSITYLEATLPNGCFAYNAAQNGDLCIDCTGDPGARQMAGVGKDCIGGTYAPTGSGCTADGRVDSYDAEGTIGLACGGTLADGVVCCSSQTGSGSTPADCPHSAPGQIDARFVADCTGFCRVATWICDEQLWPDGYPVHCSRDGFVWACLEGAACDMTTPIDFYVMLYTPETYCIFDPDTCPPEFPDPCGGVCCRSGATCLVGAHCLGVCPPEYPGECQEDGLFSGCCLEDRYCGHGCSCPSLRSCGDSCCPSGQVCRDDVCYSRNCDTGGDYPSRCQDLCCLSGADCLSQTPPGVCSCPPDLPVECGDFCCVAGSTCNNGVCTGACTGDHPIECPTQAQGLICCLAGATCEADDCTCPPELPVECGIYCGGPGAQDIGGDCLIPECGAGTVPCGNFCCINSAECIQVGECGCPPGFTVPCDLMCCLEGGTCDPGGCTGGCGGDYPDFCATGSFGPECCPGGNTCGDDGCDCPPDLPVRCETGCCPQGTICNADTCQEISCDPTHPQNCGRTCCREDSECITQFDCSCPESNPVNCGPRCCPEGMECGANATGDIICKKPPKPNGGTCPGGWKGSTRTCGAVGTSDPCRCIGETDVCITKEQYEQGTGLPFPASCAAEETTGCINNQGILVKPCCPGLTCKYRSQCGGPSNGQCLH